MAREILKSVRHDRTLYRAGKEDADALDNALTPDEVSDYKSRKLISGNFTGKAEPDEDEELEIDEDEDEDEEIDEDSDLPNGFPARMQLMRAGFDTPAKVREASDEDLLALDNLGDATLAKIREALA